MHSYLLNSIFITLLECQNFTSPLLSVINLLPSLHLFLLQQGDSIGKKLGVPLDAEMESKY